MPWFGLEEEEEISVSLRFLIVGEESFLHVCCIFKMARNLVLLQ